MRPAAASASCGQGLNGLPDRMDDPGRLLGPASRDAAAALAGSVGARAAGPLWPVWPAGLAETAGVAGVAGAAYGEGCAAGVPDDKVIELHPTGGITLELEYDLDGDELELTGVLDGQDLELVAEKE